MSDWSQLDFDQNYMGYEQISTSPWPEPQLEICPECGQKYLGKFLCINCGYDKATGESDQAR